MSDPLLEQLEGLLQQWGVLPGEALPHTLLPQLHSSEARQALAQVVLALFEQWNLHRDNQGELLGLEDIEPVYRRGELPDDEAVLQRVGHLLAMARTLKGLYPYAPAARERWVWRHNRLLDGATPMELMLAQGVAGMRRVRRLLEQQLNSGGMA